MIWCRLTYQWVCLNLGPYQVYEVKPVDQHHYIELTIIPDSAMPPEYEEESYKESRDLITAIKGFIHDLMKEHMAAIVEESPVECFIPCPICNELHIKLESIPSTGRCYCPIRRNHCDLPAYCKVLLSKGTFYVRMSDRCSCMYLQVQIPLPNLLEVYLYNSHLRLIKVSCINISYVLLLYDTVGPTMRLIKTYIIPKIAARWEDVADFLDYEPETIELIKQKHHGDGEQCCDGLIRDWLSTNHGVGPKTWATLLERLKEIKVLATATSDIERQLKKLGML